MTTIQAQQGSTTGGGSTAPPRLELAGITKAFPGVVANKDVSLTVRSGEVHALLGENGAGKSTLMKILYGFYRADAGTIRVDGREVSISNPTKTKALGIGMVFQQFMLAPALTVRENIALGLRGLPFELPQAELDAQVRALSERYGFGLNPATPVRNLSIGEQQRVEIAKLLVAKANVLIFDEPTSVLAPHESDALMEIFRQLREDGLAVLFITHKLREVLAVADRVTVLRRGQVAATLDSMEDVTPASLVKLMLPPEEQQALEEEESEAAAKAGLSPTTSFDAPPILEIEGAEVDDPTGRMPLVDITLKIHPGEILGVAGVAGNGQKELGDVVTGMRPPRKGSMRFLGQAADGWSPGQFIEMGLGCLPEDPLRMGAVPAMTGVENIGLPQRRSFSRWGGLQIVWSEARRTAVDALRAFKLGSPALDKPLGQLSGGNVQRVVFARELAREPRLMISFYPTRGMDVPSAEAARQVLRDQRARGAGILLVSEDLDELFTLSDRLLVMLHGRFVSTVSPR